MFQEYIELYKTYTQKYGPKTAIFLMVGSFYELYEIQNQETGETRCNVKELIDFLGCQASIKKDIEPGCDGLVAGFPDYALHKWAGRLTSAGWTVVIVDQVKDIRGKVKERKVARILSPSTHIENINAVETPYVVVLYFNQIINNPPSFGAGALDLTTGTTITYSGVANGRQDIWTADDLVQMLSVFQPKELIIYWKSDIQQPDEAFFRRIFGILQSIPVYVRRVETLGSFSKELVKSEYLQKVYSIKSILPAKTYLGLRSDNEELSLLFLLQFIEEHYPNMLKSFHRNEPWIPEARLICGNHALTQLQMTGTNIHETVIGLFDKCITVMGKRSMRDRLLSPYSEGVEIRNRLNEVKEYLGWNEIKTKELEKQLRFIYDLPRLHRKLLCGLILPTEVSGLFQSYNAIKIIIEKVVNNSLLKEPFTDLEWRNYIQTFQTNFDEDKALKSNCDISIFNIEKYKDIGEKEKEIKEILEGFIILRNEIATNANISEDLIRLEQREKEPFGFKASSIVLQHIKKNTKNVSESIKISELKSGGWIDCVKLQNLNTNLQKHREQLDNLIKTYLIEACLEIANAGKNIWTAMEQWICHIDCVQCIGRVSRERGFICPDIDDIDDKGSSLEIHNLRHPLVEALSTRVSYVKHDIALGGDKAKGWTVYGMNASGKSTLMKATGLCVLLAQAGCFVPAKKMRLKPFKAIYTRILNQDNLFAGLSSFAVEMSELRDILRNANEYTLVLGDELCAGTESTSAQALVASGIQWLAKKNSKFIFATHLHDLPKLINTKELGVEVWHLHVDYDPVTKKLTYDRSLRPGSGSTLYGLEVARAMDLPFEFVENALKNRHMLIGSTNQQNALVSSWNTEIIRKECEICKTNIISELEVHHIEAREHAINNILSDGTHMNDKRNLITICKKCHDDVHAGKYEINSIKITSEGQEREIIKKDNSTQELYKEISFNDKLNGKLSKKGKWSEEQMNIIIQTLKTYSTLSLKSIRGHLYSKHGIEISEGVLSKIRKDF